MFKATRYPQAILAFTISFCRCKVLRWTFLWSIKATESVRSNANKRVVGQYNDAAFHVRCQNTKENSEHWSGMGTLKQQNEKNILYNYRSRLSLLLGCFEQHDLLYKQTKKWHMSGRYRNHDEIRVVIKQYTCWKAGTSACFSSLEEIARERRYAAREHEPDRRAAAASSGCLPAAR